MTEVWIDEKKSNFRESLSVAYYNAAFQRSKRMPKLDKVIESLDKKSERKKMTGEEMFEIAKRICAKKGR